MTSSQGAPSVLIIDDDERFATVMARHVARLGFQCRHASSGAEAFELIGRSDPEIVLLDLQLGEEDGLTVLEELKSRGVTSEIVILTGHGSVETAIAAMKAGAFDYITKPCKLAELEVILGKVLESYRLKEQNTGLRQYLAVDSPRAIITRSPRMLQILESLDRIAGSEVPVLITGESGTGKELIARELHNRAGGTDRPFVTVNCAVLQPTILESELFGHEKGAFTGADRRRLGLFEIADGGTIFLDEIGEIGPSIQAKLLRVLQFGEFRRVGGNDVRTTTVRVIAATNKDLEEASRSGHFRPDLFFRLNVVQIDLPTLAERIEDVEPLVKFFIDIYGGGRQLRVTDEAISVLSAYSWPGNIRELENVVRRLLIFHDQEEIDESTVLALLPDPELRRREPILPLFEVERRHIMRALAHFGGNKKQAARTLGISLKTLYNKLHSYGWKPTRER